MDCLWLASKADRDIMEKSDKVAGMGLPPKNKFAVYLLTFQRTMGVKR
jgi:hypothetical protein